ncbi:molybdopterin molybdotransferase [Novosphingobium kunmingense]|uniref:Molybdopterin molybdenumtransferase n=1 Tax=Novosphingobium kunmingense TaxID=1211806 RepID=A0A2N0H5I0_9SPHN|nr:molybdopterin molybdotransferase MoeA [Novosphingobium kunmingense]PKB14189.1 molybdopterin molybdotransferase [Novosphingobium kunmingense]
MISFDEAQALLAGAVRPLGTEVLPLGAVAGRVLARPVRAALASPRRDVSAMDGYALRSVDAAVGARLALVGQSAAGGMPPPPVGPGQTVRVFTGAAVPEGADLVVIQENCETEDGAVIIARLFGTGTHIRLQGSDFAAGAELLPAGRRLDPLAMVTLAASDSAEATVFCRPRVALIATGDELAAPGTARANPQAIPESVSFGVAAMIAEQGGDLVYRRSGSDDLATLTALAGEALDAADVVVITGGASVGDRDFAKPMFAAHGLEPLFAKVAIKPGKPVWLGQARGRWVLGLPGNPTSAMVTARLFLTALLAALQGRDPAALLDWTELPLAASMPPAGDRETFARMIWTATGLQPIGNQDSGVQGRLSATTWLARRLKDAPAASVGERVSALRFG